ncbi:receptor-like protein Cf-9 homolog [Punica granatum]|uniref:Receptor-like protein Cf-9 homolog n=1 Tax=Punica granatum TaxID=22663 RepID=A0A6P8C2H7_PUNGR|nr:receptor-like protein Cf-9 homolog [Punica granatum]
MQGELPKNLSSLCDLFALRLSFNYFTRDIYKILANPSSCFQDKLRFFDLGWNNFSGKLRSISALILSNSSISDIIPNWFYNSSSNIEGLDLSKNELIGQIQERFDDMMPKLLNGTLTGKCLSGGIPVSLCKMKDLFVLDLSNNQLSGTLPDWWKSLRQLGGLNLGKNNLSGKIPTSMRSPLLTFLGLHDNDFHGILSRCLSNMTSLFGVEMHKKSITQSYTTTLQYLFTVDLSNNRLNGHIVQGLMQLYNLQNLNLSDNNFEGRIPSEIANLIPSGAQLCTLKETHILGMMDSVGLRFQRIAREIMSSLIFINRLVMSQMAEMNPILVGYMRPLLRVTLASSNNEAGTTIVIVKVPLATVSSFMVIQL